MQFSSVFRTSHRSFVLISNLMQTKQKFCGKLFFISIQFHKNIQTVLKTKQNLSVWNENESNCNPRPITIIVSKGSMANCPGDSWLQTVGHIGNMPCVTQSYDTLTTDLNTTLHPLVPYFY